MFTQHFRILPAAGNRPSADQGMAEMRGRVREREKRRKDQTADQHLRAQDSLISAADADGFRVARGGLAVQQEGVDFGGAGCPTSPVPAREDSRMPAQGSCAAASHECSAACGTSRTGITSLARTLSAEDIRLLTKLEAAGDVPLQAVREIRRDDRLSGDKVQGPLRFEDPPSSEAFVPALLASLKSKAQGGQGQGKQTPALMAPLKLGTVIKPLSPYHFLSSIEAAYALVNKSQMQACFGGWGPDEKHPMCSLFTRHPMRMLVCPCHAFMYYLDLQQLAISKTTDVSPSCRGVPSLFAWRSPGGAGQPLTNLKWESLIALVPDLAKIKPSERPRLFHLPYNCALASEGRVTAQNSVFRMRIYLFHSHLCRCNACRLHIKREEPPEASDVDGDGEIVIDENFSVALAQILQADKVGELSATAEHASTSHPQKKAKQETVAAAGKENKSNLCVCKSVCVCVCAYVRACVWKHVHAYPCACICLLCRFQYCTHVHVHILTKKYSGIDLFIVHMSHLPCVLTHTRPQQRDQFPESGQAAASVFQRQEHQAHDKGSQRPEGREDS